MSRHIYIYVYKYNNREASNSYTILKSVFSYNRMPGP